MRLFGNSKIRNERLLKLSHFLIGFTLIMKGIDKAEHFHHYPMPVIFIFFAGSFIILGAAFHRRIEKKIRNFPSLFHAAEGSALILIGIILLEKGARIPYILFFIGTVYLIIGIAEFFTGEEGRQKLIPRLMLIVGTAFLCASPTALIFNLLGDGNIWMYIIAAFFAVAGISILLNRRKMQSSDA